MKALLTIVVALSMGCIEAPGDADRSATPDMATTDAGFTPGPDVSSSRDASASTDANTSTDASSVDATVVDPPDMAPDREGIDCEGCQIEIGLDTPSFRAQHFMSDVICPDSAWVRSFVVSPTEADDYGARGFGGGCDQPQAQWDETTNRFLLQPGGVAVDLPQAGTLSGSVESSLCPQDHFVLGMQVHFTKTSPNETRVTDKQPRQFAAICARPILRIDRVDQKLIGVVEEVEFTLGEATLSQMCERLRESDSLLSCTEVSLICPTGSVMTGMTHTTPGTSVEQFGIRCQPLVIDVF